MRRIEVTPTEPITLTTLQHLAPALGSVPLNPKVSDTLMLRLRKEIAPTIEEDVLDGISYYKVRLGDVGAFVEGGPQHEVVAWFSPNHGLLPRRIAILPVVPQGEGCSRGLRF